MVVHYSRVIDFNWGRPKNHLFISSSSGHYLCSSIQKSLQFLLPFPCFRHHSFQLLLVSSSGHHTQLEWVLDFLEEQEIHPKPSRLNQGTRLDSLCSNFFFPDWEWSRTLHSIYWYRHLVLHWRSASQCLDNWNCKVRRRCLSLFREPGHSKYRCRPWYLLNLNSGTAKRQK